MFSNTQAVPHEDQNRVIIDRELDESFETLPLAQYGLKDGLLLSRLKGKAVLLAIEGARHYGPALRTRRDAWQLPY
jgi:hypothetical protein